jgi:soluble lytic murein transglycosylase-like protein
MKKLLIVASCLTLMSGTTYKPVEKPSHALRMYRAIMLYSGMYQVPKHIAFNIAHLETTYRGPQDSTYNPSRVSKMGAMGPMQIRYKYASYFAERKVTKDELRDSIEFNVNLSMKILAQNYKRFKSWAKAAGAYNTGKPVINHYAKEAVKKDYQRNWLQEEDILYSSK